VRPALIASAAAWLALAGEALAAEAGPPRIVVVGRASVEAPPDHATVSIGVTTRAASAAAAIDEASAAMGKLVASARAFGLEAGDIRTGYVSLQPGFKNVRDPGGGFAQQPDGYQAANSVQIRVRDLARLGEVMRRGMGEGANRIDGLSFGLLDRARAEREAHAAAVADARDRATALAAASGVTLGPIREIRSAARGGDPVRPLRMEALRAAASEIAVEPGRLEVAAEVEITWAIAGP
jgi:uncharacterized protein YggE